jgi:hypothetical protein
LQQAIVDSNSAIFVLDHRDARPVHLGQDVVQQSRLATPKES